MKRFLLTTTCVTLAAMAIAQEPPKPGSQQPSTQPPTSQQPRSNTDVNRTGQTGATANDAILATWLIVDNENEVALSRIALQKAQSAEVKQFAQQMVDDHGRMIQKLQQFSGSSMRGTTGGTAGGSNDPSKRTTDDPSKRTTDDPMKRTADAKDSKGEYPAGQPAEASGVRTMAGGLDHERLIRDLGRQCQESATKLLMEKQGADFDRCYMGMQLGAHMKAVDTLEVFRNHASPNLRPVVEEALPTVQMHLQHVKDIVKKTEVASSEGARK